MRNRRIIFAVVGLIFLAWAVAPVQAQFMDGEEITDFILFSPKPAYQKTAQDYIQEGNDWKEKCESNSRIFDERMHAYVRAYLSRDKDAAAVNAAMKDIQNPTAEQREFLIDNSNFLKDDPKAAQYYDNMFECCLAAQKNYNKAYQMTDKDDYRQQAEIFNEGAGMYDALGQTENADKMRDAAAVARTHAASSSLFDIPLPGWLAVLGVVGGLFVLHRRKN